MPNCSGFSCGQEILELSVQCIVYSFELVIFRMARLPIDHAINLGQSWQTSLFWHGYCDLLLECYSSLTNDNVLLTCLIFFVLKH